MQNNNLNIQRIGIYITVLVTLLSCQDKDQKNPNFKIDSKNTSTNKWKDSLTNIYGISNFTNNLLVKKGQVDTITLSNQNIITLSWVMEDSSKLVFADDVKDIKINAQNASFGNGVVIDASGKIGKDGRNGRNGTSRSETGNCATGESGGNGEDGKDGLHGKNLNINMQISKIGSLKILSNGGAGGNGGKGGNGMNGTKGDCGSMCNGGNGGNSGKGGKGGNGGNAGNVKIQYKFSTTDPVGAITVESKGGKFGLGGKSGLPGKKGGRKSCPFGIENRKEGKDGKNGGTNGNGINGKDGIYTPTRI